MRLRCTTRLCFFFFSSRRRHTRCLSDWSSDVCSSDLPSLHLNPRRRLLRKRQGDLGVATEKWSAFLQSNFGANLGEVRIIGALRKMRQHQIFRDAVEAVAKPLRQVFI